MKENIDIMAGAAGMVGALLKSLKKKFSNREIIINMIVGGVISFGIVAFLTIFLPKYVHDSRIIVFVTFFAGWICNDFTDRLEKSVGEAIDILFSYFKRKTK
jgi:hypothetical protein